jgi:hypothetical protein
MINKKAERQLSAFLLAVNDVMRQANYMTALRTVAQ